MTTRDLVAAASAVAGSDAIHVLADSSGDFDGVVPGVVISPQTAIVVADTLRWAASERLSVVVTGHGTKSSWGRPPRSIDVHLRLDRLNAVVDHASADLTATIQAGAVIDDVNRVLGRQGQCLPLDPSFSDWATIGGVIATNDSGPIRHRFGTPRDQIIGITVATADGRLVKAGGRVVKNVAGYDLARLMCGSHGSLAVIVDATFKLAPVPAATATVRMTGLSAAAVRQVMSEADTRQLEPLAVEIAGQIESRHAPLTLLVRFASVPEAVSAAVDEAQAIASSLGIRADVLTGEAETACWSAHATRLFDGMNTLVRLSWLPANLSGALDALADASGYVPIALAGRAGVGAGVIALEGPPDAQAAAIGVLRRGSAVGNVVLMRAHRDVRALVDPWGPEPAAARLWAPLKHAWDPTGVLGASRGPL